MLSFDLNENQTEKCIYVVSQSGKPHKKWKIKEKYYFDDYFKGGFIYEQEKDNLQL